MGDVLAASTVVLGGLLAWALWAFRHDKLIKGGRDALGLGWSNWFDGILSFVICLPWIAVACAVVPLVAWLPFRGRLSVWLLWSWAVLLTISVVAILPSCCVAFVVLIGRAGPAH
jgi:hypothetical protein